MPSNSVRQFGKASQIASEGLASFEASPKCSNGLEANALQGRLAQYPCATRAPSD